RDAISDESINEIRKSILKSDDNEKTAAMILSLYKIHDNTVKSNAYSILKDKNSSRLAKSYSSSYFRERKDPSVISDYIELFKSLDAKKMMEMGEDGLPCWRSTTPCPKMFAHINDFRGKTVEGDDFEALRKDILEWWEENSSDKKFYWSADDSEI
nr:hypothetical protein [Spirochaetales bacterium]